MTREPSAPTCTDGSTPEEWPTFALTCTFNPELVDCDRTLDPDELFVFDPVRNIEGLESHWISAKRGGYVPLEDAR